jgi:cobalt-zinc-cadmium efflux system membrane fusion protein
LKRAIYGLGGLFGLVLGLPALGYILDPRNRAARAGDFRAIARLSELEVGVPKQALIYEGDQVRIWVAHSDKAIELRQIKPGLTNGDLVEVVGNLKPGEQIVTKGALFIDRAASGS